MKVLFLIQGEGNGHLTQAVSLCQLLRANGHEVAAVMIGSSTGTRKPSFFTDAIECPVYCYKSPGLAYTKAGGLSIGATVTRLCAATPSLPGSLRLIHSVVTACKPDLIVSFYEICGGLYNFFYKSSAPLVCIAHQYLFLHPDFPVPSKKFLPRLGLTLLTRITALRAARIYALSFSDAYASTDRLLVVPPLLRQEVRNLTPQRGDHILVYLTQPTLFGQISAWHRRNPAVPLHCFCNNPLLKTVQRIDDTLTLHPVNTRSFLDLLASCRALATTSGFESVCEAMLLDKPVMMVPVMNHYEQECNALDASLNRAGIAHTSFNLDILFRYLPQHRPAGEEARQWLTGSQDLILRSMESLVPDKRRISRAARQKKSPVSNLFISRNILTENP